MADTVEVTKKPKLTVKSLSVPSREPNGSYQMKAALNLGSALVSKSSNRRATRLSYGWVLGLSGSNNYKAALNKDTAISSSTLKYTPTVNLNSYNGLTRNSFYPHTNVKLTSVSLWEQPYNSFGKSKKVTQTRQFTVPAAPIIGAWSVNANNGTVSCTITSDAGYGHNERRRTRYTMTVYNTRTGARTTPYNTSTTSLSATLSYNVSDYQQLTYGQYVQITVKAWNQGFAGDSKVVSSTYYMSYPAVATISSVSVSSRAASGKCTVAIKPNATTYHPVDKVELEYLANSTYARANAIPGDASWSNANIVDDARCTALAMSVANLIPDAGKYTWVRVKSEHAIPNVLYRYSEPKRVTGLETPLPTAADDEIKILGEPTLGVDGESLVVALGWNADGQDDSTGTELSWADAEDAWRSTDPPETFEFTWSDGAVTYDNVNYRDSATITIKRLGPGQNVFIRARRYMDYDGNRSFGEYSNAQAQMPSSAVQAEPESVAFSLPGFVAEGSAALASWTLSSPNEQKTWALVTNGGITVANGDGITNNYNIPYERLQSLVTSNSLSMRLEVSTGGDVIASDYKSVTIVTAPTISVGVSSTITAQPMTFNLSCNMTARIIATITASGIGGQDAGGDYEQYAGDSIWSIDTVPIWTAGQSSYTATIALDAGQPFVDDASYTIAVQAIDPFTGLKSDVATANFTIAWSHQAKAPEDCVVTPSDYIDADGVHHIAATVRIVAPTGATNTDLYDVYRYTADGAQLIGTGYPAGHSVVDDYAPFGAGMDLYYRIAMRTADNDVEFADIPYEFGVKTLRFDWPFGTLELPYNIEIGDNYSKNVTFRTHMDGVNNGYWNPGVKRTAKYSSQLIRLESQEDIAAARQLARYPGSVFVRTPDGSAFEADVQINDMSTSGVMQLFSLSITEIEPTGAYDLPPYETSQE